MLKIRTILYDPKMCHYVAAQSYAAQKPCLFGESSLCGQVELVDLWGLCSRIGPLRCVYAFFCFFSLLPKSKLIIIQLEPPIYMELRTIKSMLDQSRWRIRMFLLFINLFFQPSVTCEAARISSQLYTILVTVDRWASFHHWWLIWDNAKDIIFKTVMILLEVVLYSKFLNVCHRFFFSFWIFLILEINSI